MDNSEFTSEFTADEFALAREFIADWEKARNRPNVWGLQDEIDRARFDAERRVIGVVEYFADGDMGDRKPFAWTLDGYRLIVFPDPMSESAANATLVVRDAETGEEIAYCPGQFADVTIDDD